MEGQPLLPARPPPGSKKGVVAWLRNSPILAFVLVAVFAAGLLSHIAGSDTAQSVTALTQRAAGGAGWGSKKPPSLPAQGDAVAEDEDEAEEAQEVEKPSAVPGNPTDGGATSQSSEAAAAQQDATDGDSTSSQGADGGDQQSAVSGGQAEGSAAEQQQVGGDAEQAADAAQPAAEAEAQKAGSGEQQQAQQQDQPAAELTLEEVWRRLNNKWLCVQQHMVVMIDVLPA